jgi:sugar lactone lactonase YvrE
VNSLVGTTGLRRTAVILGVLAVLALIPTLSTFAASDETYPDVISLPDGFRPEGIAVGRGTSFFASSLANGSIYGGDLRTGEGALVVPPQNGRIAVGLAVDLRSNYIFAAGGPAGAAYVYDANTGEGIAAYQLTSEASFVNDVIVTRDAAYFTDSFRPFFYLVPLGPGGALPAQGGVSEIALGGDFVQVSGFNSNGIDATPDGRSLIIVHSTLGALYRVDPAAGYASEINLHGDTVTQGDGILLDGKTLYVMRNRSNVIAVVQLDAAISTGMVVGGITDAYFDVPTTIAEFGNRIYAVNARFGTPPTPDTAYDVIQVSKH